MNYTPPDPPAPTAGFEYLYGVVCLAIAVPIGAWLVLNWLWSESHMRERWNDWLKAAGENYESQMRETRRILRRKKDGN